MEFLTKISWSPYVVGIGIGVLSWLSFLISRQPIACSTTFAKASGMIEKLFLGEKVNLKTILPKDKTGCRLAMDACCWHCNRINDFVVAVR